MGEQDYLELLPPGFTTLQELSDLDIIVATPFDENEPLANPAAYERRRFLVIWLNKFVDLLCSHGLAFELWIDGSFVTQKPNPGDVDIAVICKPEDVESLSEADYNAISALFDNKRETKLRYKCDVVLFLSNNRFAWSKWHDLYGASHPDPTTGERRPKGIIRVRVRR